MANLKKGVSINPYNGAINGVTMNAYKWSEADALSSGTLRIEQISQNLQPLVNQDSGFSVFLGIESGSAVDTGAGYGTTMVGSWCGPNRIFYQFLDGVPSDERDFEIAVGSYTGAYDTFIGSGTGMGLRDLEDESARGQSVLLGNSVMYYSQHSLRNVVIGNTAAYKIKRLEYNTIVGSLSFTSGNQNDEKKLSKIASFGYANGGGITEGSNCLILGNDIGSAELGGDNPQNVVAIGLNNRLDFKSDANGIALGNGVAAAIADGVTVKNFVIANHANLDFPDDATAATGGVPVGGVYHTSGAIKIRLS